MWANSSEVWRIAKKDSKMMFIPPNWDWGWKHEPLCATPTLNTTRTHQGGKHHVGRIDPTEKKGRDELHLLKKESRGKEKPPEPHNVQALSRAAVPKKSKYN